MKQSMTAIAAIVFGLVLTMPAYAQDADAGKKVFKKCASCHKVGEGAKNGVGPMLNGMFGRVAGTVDGFKYGKSIMEAGEAGLVWDDEQVALYITDPKGYMKDYLQADRVKVKMTYKLKKEQERLDVIAYLKQYSPEATN
ncbi:MAG: cytochrome c family protein [Pseudomonadota bacterium]